MIDGRPCRCNCGYRCGGPGRCDLFRTDMLECIKQHHERDCDHDFNGYFVYWDNGGSVTCRHCGMTAADHDCATGP